MSDKVSPWEQGIRNVHGDIQENWDCEEWSKEKRGYESLDAAELAATSVALEIPIHDHIF